MERNSTRSFWHAVVARWFTVPESRFLNLIGIDPVALSYSRAVAEWRDGGPRPDAFSVGDTDGRSSAEAGRLVSRSTPEDRSDSPDAWTGAAYSRQRHA